MKGFFTGKELDERKPPRRTNTPRARASADPCAACGLHKTCNSPKMEVHGGGRKGILCIGEGPGRVEDEKGRQFVGETGDLLVEKLKPHGIDLYEDCWTINAVNCRPPGNRTPTAKEIKACNGRVWDVIKQKNPKLIFLFGGCAVQAIYGERFGAGSISLWRKLCIPDPQANAWVVASYHPSYLIRNPTDRNLWSTFDRDLTYAVSCLNKPAPEFPDWKKYVRCESENADEVLHFLNDALGRSTISVDYETTSLQPYYPMSRILTCSIAASEKYAMAFPISYPAWNDGARASIIEALKLVLSAPHVNKIAHNFSFEEKWSRQILKTPIRGEHWCTENGAHIIDERQEFTGLKFQAFVNFGVEDYSKEVDPYKTGGIWPYNRMHEYPLDKLLLYNGADALFTYWLWKKQQQILTRQKDRRTFAFKCCMDGLDALDDASERGWEADALYYNDVEEELGSEIIKVERRLLKGPESKKFKEATSRELKIVHQDFSPEDLRTIFFDILGFTSTKKTAKAKKDAIDQDVLAEINHPFAKQLLRRRKLVKLKNTYIHGFKRAIINGRMHPTFNLHIARTPRSSCQDPNIQNVPTRDEEAKRYTRRGIIPSQGNRLGFADYGSMEIRILACHTKDAALVKYCTDPTTDMHRDEAQEIFILRRDQVSKGLRQGAKNQFVFPEVYGSYWKNCARDLWHQNMDDGVLADGTPLKDHLREKLFKGLPRNQWQLAFATHIKKVEKKFWEKYHATREWQLKSVEHYLERGYIEMFFGHRRSGYLTQNMIFNTPVQGDAFQCLLWSFARLNRRWKQKRLRTQLIGQIHDELVDDLYPPELDEATMDVEEVMTRDIRDRFSWIIVPLIVEHGLTPVDGSWYTKTSYERGGKLPEEK